MTPLPKWPTAPIPLYKIAYKLSAEAGEDFKPGPLKIEAKSGGGIEFEFGRQGLEDVTLIGIE